MLAVASAGIWDILNPELITVPTPDPDVTHPIRCLVLVRNRLWVGTGPFLAFLEMDSLSHEVRIVPWLVNLWCVVGTCMSITSVSVCVCPCEALVNWMQTNDRQVCVRLCLIV